jgi:hypothetical protein
MLSNVADKKAAERIIDDLYPTALTSKQLFYFISTFKGNYNISSDVTLALPICCLIS